MPPFLISRYLESRGVQGPWKISGNGGGNFLGAIVIPVLAEKGSLFKTLDSLSKNPSKLVSRFLTLLVVNHRPDANPADKIDNEESLSLLARMERTLGPLKIGWVDAASQGLELPLKDGGVGMARKIGFDLALTQLNFDDVPPLLVSLDADTLVRPDYLPAIRKHFQETKEGGAVIPFCHQKGETPEQEAAIQRYELFLRSYVLGLEQAGSPYAFHTVGSTMAFRADAYARMGGMNRRKAGEDFYFLQHLAKTAGVRNLKGTIVFPSPRISHRVPFGTGPSISRFLAGEKNAVLFYRPECFQILRDWLALVSRNLDAEGNDLLRKGGRISESLGSFLRQIHFPSTWQKLQKNFPAPALLLRGFHHWFDGLKTLKLIRHLSAGSWPRSEPDLALPELLKWAGLQPLEGIDQQLTLLQKLQGGGSV